jgi:hypothetical protein
MGRRRYATGGGGGGFGGLGGGGFGALAAAWRQPIPALAKPGDGVRPSYTDLSPCGTG